ncbi:unnamed protein product [Adineta ricciae]|uniref:Uncharacterized protein n=1 Tax=Adineta ricciae TaxID=249248 RepID=A0A814WJX5_ADIRI|nr:unnamed protein product [Adineta ricciae]CAF1428281.1 unnamed protein product [Adineta ricciae]
MILYNRIPKCGSSLLNVLFEQLSSRTGAFIHKFGHSESLYHRLSIEEQYNLTRDIRHHVYVHSPRPTVLLQHFHFLHVASTSNATFYYINQYRDPLARTLSSFDFRRFGCTVSRSQRQCLMIHPSLRNMTMDECVSTGDPSRCITNPYGVRSPIPYFCGHLSICDDSLTRPTSDAALALAKTNIERYFIHVGLLEYLESSLRLLEHIQPSIFTGLLDAYVNGSNRRIVNRVPKKYRHNINNRTRNILLQLLKPEYELYNFIRARFIDHYTRVFHQAPIYQES